jgi:hypothetical protein
MEMHVDSVTIETTYSSCLVAIRESENGDNHHPMAISSANFFPTTWKENRVLQRNCWGISSIVVFLKGSCCIKKKPKWLRNSTRYIEKLVIIFCNNTQHHGQTYMLTVAFQCGDGSRLEGRSSRTSHEVECVKSSYPHCYSYEARSNSPQIVPVRALPIRG